MIDLLRTVFQTYESLFEDYPATMFWLARF